MAEGALPHMALAIYDSRVTRALVFSQPGISPNVNNAGEVAEWLKAHAWKACRRVTVSRVRIPLSPPFVRINLLIIFIIIDY